MANPVDYDTRDSCTRFGNLGAFCTRLFMMLRQPKGFGTFHRQQRNKDQAECDGIALARQSNQSEHAGQGREYHQQHKKQRRECSHVQLAVTMIIVSIKLYLTMAACLGSVIPSKYSVISYHLVFYLRHSR